ncbi:MAG TPA: Ig-like domain-containing protein [Candidatus Evtepia faecigallinarum]|nr:Ig-like domain-containing protein [Candidatus Evtepia faecigallinarum]
MAQGNGDNTTITIHGGTVTATGGATGAGIGGAGGTFSTGTDGSAGNAVIFASSATGSSIQDTSNQSSWQGVFFLGNEAGKIYGTSVTPTEDFTIPSGKTLTIENGKTLTIQGGVTVTNEGTLTVEAGGKLTVSEGGTLTVEAGGTLTGSVNDKQPPQITASPADVSATEGSAATFTVTASAGEGESADTLSYQWQQKTTSEGSAWEDISGAAAYSYTTETTNTGMSGYQYRCVVTGEASRVSVVSSAATLTVTAKVPVTSVTLDKDTLNLTVGGTGTLTATVSPDTATDKTVIWSSDHPQTQPDHPGQRGF